MFVAVFFKIKEFPFLKSSLDIPVGKKSESEKKNTPHVFHVETTWKPPFPRRFNVEYAWCVCREVTYFHHFGSIREPRDH